MNVLGVVSQALAVLGEALASIQRFDDAEKTLLTAYEGLVAREKGIPAAGKIRIRETVSRLVDLYGAWKKKDKEDEWRKKLSEMKEECGRPSQRCVPRANVSAFILRCSFSVLSSPLSLCGQRPVEEMRNGDLRTGKTVAAGIPAPLRLAVCCRDS